MKGNAGLTTFIPTIPVEYYVNNEGKKEGNLSFSYFNFINDSISYENITYSFYVFFKYYSFDKEGGETPEEFIDIKPNNIKYEFIRYFDGEGWILLNEKEVIFFDDDFTFNNLKIMIKATISTEEQIDIEKEYDNINKKYNYIEDDFKEINYNYVLPPDNPLNLVVLIANPLADNGKELRTMNDFNIITSKIYNLFNKEDYLNYTEFGPLTKNALKNIITDEKKIPVILHLICKSTYLIEDDNIINEDQPIENNNDCTYLIFEKNYDSNDQINNYNLEFINKEKLKNEIFNFEDNPGLKENISKITLIISTPLAEDVYNIFKDFGFKNILIQHTTLADVNFISEFNKTFYKSLITYLSRPINIIYEEALNIGIDKINPPRFCCCLHRHKKDCDFMKNINNEFYNYNYSQDLEKLEKEEIFEEIEKTIPHFNHLLPKCYFSNINCFKEIWRINLKSGIKYPENSFSFHDSKCFEGYHFKELKPYQIKNKVFYNICCCDTDPKIHCINNVFPKDFNDSEKNNEIRFRIPEIMKENKYIPKYEKMELLVGKNYFVLEVLKFFFSVGRYLNVWGDNIENLKKFGNIVKEYYLERYHFYESKEEEDEVTSKIKKISSFPKLNISMNANKKNEELKLKEIQSSPALLRIRTKIKEVIEIDLNNDNEIILNDEQKQDYNIIYFIYVYDKKLVKEVNFIKSKVVWFSENKLTNVNNINKSIKVTKEPTLKPEKYYQNPEKVNINEYIKFQNEANVINCWREKKND